MRVVKTIGIVVAIYIAAIVMEMIMASISPEYQGGITVIVILGALAFLSPKVGYRWFDCFFAVIPFYGIFYIFKICYRVAHLPNRDWNDRLAVAEQ